MSRDLHFPISDHDAETIKHIEPARLIDAAVRCLQRAHAETPPTLAQQRLLGDLQKVRNAWVLILGTARLQVMGGER